MKKRIIFDVGHPAQVHNFKHVYWDLKEKGWEGLFTAKDKEVTISLLDKYNLPYVIIGKTSKGLLSKFIHVLASFVRFFKVLFVFKPDIVICRFSLHSTWCSFLLRKPVIGLADTEHTKMSDLLTVSLTNAKLTSESYFKDLGRNHFRFNANIELFYLHPKRFESFSLDIFDYLGIERNTDYIIVRFVSWAAHHDIGEMGFDTNQKISLIEALSARYVVFISSEGILPPELEKFKINISPCKMHEALAFASLYVGEGASMASEAACLGTLAIYVNTLTAGSIIELEQSGLLVHYSRAEDCIKNIDKHLNSISEEELISKKERFLEKKIDASGFLVWFIENYPQSVQIMKENPDYQYNFR